jgi:hypothetical protein
LRRSRLIVSGIVSVTGMPRAAATKARAMPVLPLVGSTISLPLSEQTILLGVRDHRGADAALHRVGGVAPLDLGVDHSLGLRPENAVEPHQGGAADRQTVVVKRGDRLFHNCGPKVLGIGSGQGGEATLASPVSP